MRRFVLPVLKETPWLAGVVAGWALLWIQGRAFVLGETPLGFGWWDYLMLTWHRIHPIAGQGGSWRNPLYLAWVEWLGRDLGYADAAVIISSISVYLLVFSTGFTGRMLGSTGVGALAALSIPLVRTTAEASRWMTLYPPLAAVSGIAVTVALALALRPHAALALATGAVTGLAWALDWRGLLMVVPVGLLTAVAVVRTPRRRWLPPLLVLAGLGVGPLGILGLGGTDLLPVKAQVEEQAQVVRRWMATTRDPALARDCLALPEANRSGLPYLGSTCPKTLLVHNLTHDFPREMPFGLLPTLVLLPLVLLPGKRGWTGLVTSGAAVAVPMALLLASALWILLPDRYILHFAGITALVVPLGLSRLARTALPRRWGPGLEVVLLVAAGIWLLRVGPPDRDRRTKMEMNEDIQMAGHTRAALQAYLGPDDRLLDCSETHMEPLFLPRLLHSGPPMLSHVEEARCAAWDQAPDTGGWTSWLLTGANNVPENPAWEEVFSTDGHGKQAKLWRLRPAAE